MAIRAFCVALLLASLPIAGCGTVANLAKPGPEQGGKIPFGGVKQDVWCMKKAANRDFGGRTLPQSEAAAQGCQAAVILACAADLPCSFVGDVVTLPYTAAYCYINQPIPVPPMPQAPPPPVQQTIADSPPPASPIETLPAPMKQP
jgi:uncharacterized protein YceK